MSPATHHSDALRQIMIPGLSVRVQIPPKSGQKLFWVFLFLIWLGLIQHDGVLRVPACPIQPHIALALWLLPRLIHKLQPVFLTQHQPVGHSLPGKLHALPFQLLLLPVQRTAHHEFLRRNVRHRLCGRKTTRNQRRLLRHLHHRSFGLAFPAGIGIIPVLP